MLALNLNQGPAMFHAPFRPHAPRSLVVAAGAAVVLHVLGSLALSGAGWVGRGEPSHSPVQPGGASFAVAGVASSSRLRVRLTRLEPLIASAVHDKQGEVVSSAPQALPALDDSQLLLDQAPPAAGGSATFSSTYLSAEEVDQGPVPEPGWILDEGALSEVGRARMRLRLWVSERGHIDRVVVIHAEPAGRWVDEAIRPLPDTRMRPAERDGRPVAATIVVELSADLETLR